MEFKINGCKITILPSFMLMLCLVLLIDKTGIMLFSLFSAFVHEIGHIVFIIFSKKKIEKIFFQIGGVLIDSKGIVSYNKELLIAFGGCLFNLIFFLMFLILYMYCNNELFIVASASNFGLFLFNIMPIENLDGMDLLKIILAKNFEHERVSKVAKIISLTFLLFTFIVSLLFVYYNKINSIILICLTYLFIISIIFKKTK